MPKEKTTATAVKTQHISKAGKIPIYYDRNDPKWEPDKKAKMYGTAELQVALDKLAGLMAAYGHQIEMFLSAGMYVAKAKQHGKGRAVDLDGIVRKDGTRLMAHTAEKNWKPYLAYEGVIRQVFGQVLNYDYNIAHHDHWHCDLAEGLGYRPKSTAQTAFAQRALNVFWQSGLVLDGAYGPKTEAAFQKAMGTTMKKGWLEFLDAVAKKHPSLPKTKVGP